MTELEKLEKILPELPEEYLHMVYVAASTLHEISQKVKGGDPE